MHAIHLGCDSPILLRFIKWWIKWMAYTVPSVTRAVHTRELKTARWPKVSEAKWRQISPHKAASVISWPNWLPLGLPAIVPAPRIKKTLVEIPAPPPWSSPSLWVSAARFPGQTPWNGHGSGSQRRPVGPALSIAGFIYRGPLLWSCLAGCATPPLIHPSLCAEGCLTALMLETLSSLGSSSANSLGLCGLVMTAERGQTCRIDSSD